MTTPSTARKAGPLLGNGSTTAFPFSFKVFAAGDIKVTIANSSGVETVLALNTDYSVSLNANQDTSPGGTVTYPVSGSPLPVGSRLAITGDIDYDQPLDLPTGGSFSAVALENQLDRAAMQIQQLAEQMSRAAKVPVSSTEDADTLVGDLVLLADMATEIDSVATSIASVNTVAGISSAVKTVAENLLDISNFAEVYIGPAGSDPVLRFDGSAIRTGDLYFNTTVSRMRVYSGAEWVDVGPATPVTITVNKFSGTGSQTGFTLSVLPGFSNAVSVSIAGVQQRIGIDYTVTGTTLTFTSPPASGTNNIYVTIISAYSGGVPNDGSVTPVKLSSGAPSWDSGGRLSIVGGIKARSGAPGALGVNNNGYAFSGDADSGLFSAADGQVDVYANNALRLRVTTDRVQIGNTDRTAAFSVAAAKQGDWNNRTLLVEDSSSVTSAPGIGFHAPANSAAGILKFNGAFGRFVFANSDDTGTADLQLQNLFSRDGAGRHLQTYGCRAWVNFNGTGTPSIRASGNVSSITDNGVGDYTINFTTSMTDANYAVVGSGTYNNSESWAIGALTTATYTSGFRVVVKQAGVGIQDMIGANIAVFR